MGISPGVTSTMQDSVGSVGESEETVQKVRRPRTLPPQWALQKSKVPKLKGLGKNLKKSKVPKFQKLDKKRPLHRTLRTV